jgi:uncharacterized protein
MKFLADRRRIFLQTLLISITLTTLTNCVSSNEQIRQAGPRKIEVFFLGHDSEHHNSARHLPGLASALAKEGINFTYSNDPADLNDKELAKYDAVMIYANHDSITNEQERALVSFVESGHGFLPIHCASFCFQNSPAYINLVGGQFQSHDTATFSAKIINRQHPVTDSLKEFSSWDETYVHHKLSDDRTVLMVREQNGRTEPWTWVREQGKGRVFYTASGHDEKTWTNPEFINMIREGLLWSVGEEAANQWRKFKKTLPTLTYRSDPNIPNYEQRKPSPQYQAPLTAEESGKLIQVPVGFDLQLFASEPDLHNPISMDWDERGRLWVIETVDYPNSVNETKGEGDDRIKICEDTDGDGKADKFTVFADNLNIPTSFVFSNGGIVVSQAPDFLFLKDTDGDDKADVKKVLLSGWGTFDTHAGPSNLQYGVDNWIWGVVGYSGFEGHVGGKHLEFSQGVYRFKPDASDFEYVTSTSNNTWGLGFTENNEVFASTANNTHSVFVGIPLRFAENVRGIPTIGSKKIDGHYAMHPITDKVRQVDVFGGFTAASGHRFYTARAFPSSFWETNTAFVCEPTGHLVHIAKFTKDGAGYLENDGWNLFAGVDEWVSPVEAKVGPDGAVWVADWYDFIIQHNPTPTAERGGYDAKNGKGNAYENPLRDKKHGRIWRVVSRNSTPSKTFDLARADASELIDVLFTDNMFWRLTAQRLLVERADKDIVDDLIERADFSGDASETKSLGTLHVLWTLDGLQVFKEDIAEAIKLLRSSMNHPAMEVRRAAVQIAAKNGILSNEIVKKLHDKDARVQMEAILSTADIPSSSDAGAALYTLSKNDSVAKDSWRARAIYFAASNHKKKFIDAFNSEHPDYRPKSQGPREKEDFIGADDDTWPVMNIPQYIEDAGLDMDGVVWFRKEFNLSQKPAGAATLSLGPIDDSDETWVNGVKVGATAKNWQEKRKYSLKAGTLRQGSNVITVRVEDTGGGGGIYGKKDDLFLQTGQQRIGLSGAWKYQIEKQSGGDNDKLFENESIAEIFVRENRDGSSVVDGEQAGATNARRITIGVIQNKMKFDLPSFTVKAGEPVEIKFVNPDFMQHNLVITKPGMLETVGKAADKLAADPGGSELQYVPQIPEVLYSTKLLDPEGEVVLRFNAPEDAGDYPFVCTFPGHWSVMNGVMKVVR